VVAFFAVLGVAYGVWLSRIPAIKQHLHLSDSLLGLALLAAPAGLVIAVPLAGRIVHKTGSRLPVLAAGSCVALAPILMGVAANVAALMASLFAFGFAGGILDVGMNAQAVHVERGCGRPLMSSFHACFSFGGLAGALLGGVFAWAGVGPALNFAAVGITLALTALLAGRWLLRDRPGADDRPQTAASGQPRPRMTMLLLVLALLAICSLLGEGAAEGWSAVYLRDNLHTAAAFAALGYAGFSVAMAFGRLSGDRLAAWLGPAAVLRCCGLLAAAGLATALLSRSPGGAIAGFTLFGAGLSCTFPLMLSAAGNADPLQPAHGIARVAGLGYIGMLGGPVLIGTLAGRLGLAMALAVPVLLALVVAAGAGAVGERTGG
jgi:predicted MFS family arabinose efflux permease